MARFMSNIINKKVLKMMEGSMEDQLLAKEIIARGKLTDRDYKFLFLCFMEGYWTKLNWEKSKISSFVKDIANTDDRSSRTNRKFITGYKKLKKKIENE